jgi:hypothetical protein
VVLNALAWHLLVFQSNQSNQSSKIESFDYTMRQLIYLLLISMTVTLLFEGCSDKSPRYYYLQLLVSDPLGKASDPLPDDIVQLTLPFGKCGDIFLVPVPSLERLGVEKSDISLETQIKPGSGDDKNDIRFIEKRTRDNVKSMKVGETYAKPSPQGLDLQNHYEAILASESATAKVLIFSKNLDLTEFQGKKVHHHIDSLRFAIAQLVCEDDMILVKVLLEPLTTQQKVPAKTVEEPKPPEKPILPSTKAEIDDFTEAIEIEHESKSWEELYEKASRYILTEDEHRYGHPSAYCYVICAAEKAIDTKTTQQMVVRMSTDCPGNDLSNNICRLKVGHETFWNRVKAATLDRNSEELEELEEGLVEKWKNQLSGGN